jgi:hypothetical protein
VAQSRIYYEKLERVKQSLGRMEVDPKLQARVIKCEEISTRSPLPHPIDTSSAHSRLSFACPGCDHVRARTHSHRNPARVSVGRSDFGRQIGIVAACWLPVLDLRRRLAASQKSDLTRDAGLNQSLE